MDPNHEVSRKNINVITSKPFSQMSGSEKAQHIGKIFVFLITCGFAFPTILSD